MSLCVVELGVRCSWVVFVQAELGKKYELFVDQQQEIGD